MNRMLPIVLQMFICGCVVPIFVLPGTLFGLILKGIFGLCILILLRVAYNKMMLPGTFVGAVFFSLAIWFFPSWPMYLFLVAMLGIVFLTWKTAETFYGRIR